MNDIEKGKELKATLLEAHAYSDDTAFFQTRAVAEKFTELVKENLLHTIPPANNETDFGMNKFDGSVPKRI